MSDKFHPVPLDRLAAWIFRELRSRNSIFGIPRASFFAPALSDRFRSRLYGTCLETPIGVAAGPHAQMAQNIVSAWLCGARFIELKTVQTLDELEIGKPCIAVRAAGFNIEWSHELKLEQSLDEYLRAWVLIHVLHRVLGFHGASPGVVFNMSVGYDLAGIRQPNMQAFLRGMLDAGEQVDRALRTIVRYVPEAAEVTVPHRLSSSVTLSTMHGCPPDEIGRIASELMARWKLNTSVKLNPTLLGPERVRETLAADPRARHLEIPDEAFEHDLRYEQAVTLVRSLQAVATQSATELRIKVSNTLEVKNPGGIFRSEDRHVYMSGPPLHALSVSLAHQLAETFPAGPAISFCAGASAGNMADLVACGLHPVTVCTDLLKPRGYLRFGRYLRRIDRAMAAAGVADLPAYVRRVAGREDSADVRDCARHNLGQYAGRVAEGLRGLPARRPRARTPHVLPLFDCRDHCAVCAGVCPNRAIQTYGLDSDRTDLSHDPQVAVLADLCNECGNCACFCPAGGRPYREKPRLYLDRDAFEAETDNAFRPSRRAGALCVEARFQGTTYAIVKDSAPAGLAEESRATMSAVLRALEGPLSYLVPEEESGT